METTETKEVKKWYKRVWEHLRISRETSFGIRGLLVMALMLCGIGLIANATSTPHWWSTMIAATLIMVLGLWFGYRMRHWRPSGSWSAFRRLFAEFQYGRGARRYRRFIIGNLAILAIYVAVVFHSWYLALFNDWFYLGDWQMVWQRTGQLVTYLVVIGTGVVVLWVGWEVIQRIKATFGRREPYEQAIRKWQRALEDERRAHAQLREAQSATGKALALAIALIRSGKNRTARVQCDLAIRARRELEQTLAALISNDQVRKALLYDAREKVECEDEEQPSTPTTPPQA